MLNLFHCVNLDFPIDMQTVCCWCSSCDLNAVADKIAFSLLKQFPSPIIYSSSKLLFGHCFILNGISSYYKTLGECTHNWPLSCQHFVAFPDRIRFPSI